MRTVLAVVAVTFLASCATTSPGNTATVYHHKYHQFYSVKKQPESEFVGAGARESAKDSHWLRPGSPRNYPY